MLCSPQCLAGDGSSPDDGRLFVQVGITATLPGNTCCAAVTNLSIRAVLLMHSPLHHYKALQRPLKGQCGTGHACFCRWSPWPLSCASALSGPRSLPWGPCSWWTARAPVSVAFQHDSSSSSSTCPATAVSFNAAATVSISNLGCCRTSPMKKASNE